MIVSDNEPGISSEEVDQNSEQVQTVAADRSPHRDHSTTTPIQIHSSELRRYLDKCAVAFLIGYLMGVNGINPLTLFFA